jgi:Sulfotransferase domain
VTAGLPRDRLLVMSVGEGWGPLCDFLACDVPDVDFPRVNDGGDFQRRIKANANE